MNSKGYGVLKVCSNRHSSTRRLSRICARNSCRSPSFRPTTRRPSKSSRALWGAHAPRVFRPAPSRAGMRRSNTPPHPTHSRTRGVREGAEHRTRRRVRSPSPAERSDSATRHADTPSRRRAKFVRSAPVLGRSSVDGRCALKELHTCRHSSVAAPEDGRTPTPDFSNRL